jgi:aryl-alcohol dehydrogenase-like predicted oxidoreductase
LQQVFCLPMVFHVSSTVFLGVNFKAHLPLPGVGESPTLGRKMMMRNKIKDSGFIIEALNVIAQKYAATAAQVALNWLINFHGETVVAIPGASKVHQAEESAGVMKFKLSDEEIAQLDALSSDFR